MVTTIGKITSVIVTRFGMTKVINFQADSAKELSFLAQKFAKQMNEMTQEVFVELPNFKS